MLTETISTSRSVAGRVIGKQGRHIIDIQKQSCTRIRSENFETECQFIIEAETEKAINHAINLINAQAREPENRNALTFVILDYPPSACDNLIGALLQFRFVPVPDSPAVFTVKRQMYKALLCATLPDLTAPAVYPVVTLDQDPFLPRSGSFCVPASIPHCLDVITRQVASAIRYPQQVTLTLRFGMQLFYHYDPRCVLPHELDVSELCKQRIGYPTKLTFQNGVEDSEAAVLIDWLALEGFDRIRVEGEETGRVNLHFQSTRGDGMVIATLKWDEICGAWKQTKLKKSNHRLTILTFLQASSDRLDFRLLLSSQRNNVLPDLKFKDYLHKLQENTTSEQRRAIRFGPTAELGVDCVRYKIKNNFRSHNPLSPPRNAHFKVSLTSVEQGQVSGHPGHTLEVSVSHHAWRRLKSATRELGAGPGDGEPSRDVARIAQEAVEAVTETIELARRMCRVMGERKLWWEG
ncbi:hypothetical protein BC937DRAFT_89122 [Endogone sp. FLAS-F59071]|nr:hypothetical protein BC937DRAFT_89122 [Endogone sp. FLAS-F59071]|eukprot:RUS18128.1 hypothetical protein BC937DRAFT_89122 [Endogone sp. FLAS-F59071]